MSVYHRIQNRLGTGYSQNIIRKSEKVSYSFSNLLLGRRRTGFRTTKSCATITDTTATEQCVRFFSASQLVALSVRTFQEEQCNKVRNKQAERNVSLFYHCSIGEPHSQGSLIFLQEKRGRGRGAGTHIM